MNSEADVGKGEKGQGSAAPIPASVSTDCGSQLCMGRRRPSQMPPSALRSGIAMYRCNMHERCAQTLAPRMAGVPS